MNKIVQYIKAKESFYPQKSVFARECSQMTSKLGEGIFIINNSSDRVKITRNDFYLFRGNKRVNSSVAEVAELLLANGFKKEA